MPTVNIQPDVYLGSWASGAFGSTTPTNLQLPHDDNTTRAQANLPNRGAKWDLGLNRPAAVASVASGTWYMRSWRNSSYSGSLQSAGTGLHNGTSFLSQKSDGGPIVWTTTSQSYTISTTNLPIVQFWANNFNANPTDVRLSTVYYNVNYTPAGGGGYRWLIAGFLMGALWVPNLAGQIGGGLGMEHMPAIQAALPGATYQGRFLEDNELGAALADIKAGTNPVYSFSLEVR